MTLTSVDQLDFDSIWIGTIQAQYEAWRQTPDGRLIYREARRRALRLRGRGWDHFGIGAIWESMRYDRAVKVGPDAEGFKLNDKYTSRLARELMAREPALDGLFELRELRTP